MNTLNHTYYYGYDNGFISQKWFEYQKILTGLSNDPSVIYDLMYGLNIVRNNFNNFYDILLSVPISVFKYLDVIFNVKILKQLMSTF